MRNSSYRIFYMVVVVSLMSLGAFAQTTDCSTIVASATNSGPYMVGQSIALNTNSVTGATYTWTGPEGFSSSLQDPTIGDAAATNAGTYSVTIASECGSANATTTVAVYGQPTISIGNVIAKAPAKGTVATDSFHITLSNPSSMPVTVNYFTSNQTAMAGKDYVITRGTAVFAPGVVDQVVSVPVLGNGSRTQKQFLVNLVNPVNASIAMPWGFPSRGTGVIQP